MSLTFDEFRTACFNLGQNLAKSGHKISVQHDRDDAVDRYVVEGYLECSKELNNASADIAVWYPRRSESAEPFAVAARENPSVFSLNRVESGKWDSARFQMCFEAEATIVVAGQARTETTGYFVLGAAKTLIPISCFGGAAAALLTEVERRVLGAEPLPQGLTTDDLKHIWSDDLFKKVCETLDLKAKVVLIHGRAHDAVKDVLSYIRDELGHAAPQIMQLDYVPGETLPEKWERIAGSSRTVAIAIASADDEGRVRGEERLALRARQNVWLEVGWFWGKLAGRKGMLILPQFTSEEGLEVPSDLQGLEMFSWHNSPLEQKEKIKSFLRSFG